MPQPSYALSETKIGVIVCGRLAPTLAAGAAAVTVLFAGSAASATPTSSSTALKTGGLPAMRRIIPRRLPPFIAYDYSTPSVYGISLVRPDGSDAHLIPSEANAEEPSWSPNGRRILYTAGCVIWVMNADGSDQRPVVPARANPADVNCRFSVDQPRWAPNSDRIVFSSGAYPTIRVANVDGSHVHLVPHTQGGIDASFSPDGRYIIFGRYSDYRRHGNPFDPHIYVIRPNGTGLREIATGGEAEAPSWSPDGNRLIYACSIYLNPATGDVVTLPTSHALCEISRTDPKPRKLYSVPSGGYFGDGTWSADGREIVVMVDDGVTSQVALMAPTGGPPVEITHPPAYTSDPDW